MKIVQNPIQMATWGNILMQKKIICIWVSHDLLANEPPWSSNRYHGSIGYWAKNQYRHQEEYESSYHFMSKTYHDHHLHKYKFSY